MANKNINGKWACSFCGKEYNELHEAETCREKHELIYFPLTKKEINAILQFIYTRDEELIKDDLVKRIQKYVRAAAKPLTHHE